MVEATVARIAVVIPAVVPIPAVIPQPRPIPGAVIMPPDLRDGLVADRIGLRRNRKNSKRSGHNRPRHSHPHHSARSGLFTYREQGESFQLNCVACSLAHAVRKVTGVGTSIGNK